MDVEFETRCPICEGRGVTVNPEWTEWHEHVRGGGLLQDAPPMPKDESGEVVPEEKQCSNCGGVGTVPTWTGRKLLEFVERHGD